MSQRASMLLTSAHVLFSHCGYEIKRVSLNHLIPVFVFFLNISAPQLREKQRFTKIKVCLSSKNTVNQKFAKALLSQLTLMSFLTEFLCAPQALWEIEGGNSLSNN